jgi:hypothetical protein
VVKNCGNEVQKLEIIKMSLKENIGKCGRPNKTSEETRQTKAIPLPFCLIWQLKENDYELVELAGIEPATS